jgi:hypothetical protein
MELVKNQYLFKNLNITQIEKMLTMDQLYPFPMLDNNESINWKSIKRFNISLIIKDHFNDNCDK